MLFYIACPSNLFFLYICNLPQMHIVTIKKGLTTEEAKNQSDGFAVLGFFINVRVQFSNDMFK